MSEPVTTIGGNAAARIFKAITDIEAIDAEIGNHKVDLKEIRKGLKGKDLPVSGLGPLVARHFKDEEQVKEKLDELAVAGTILGIKVPTRFDREKSLSHLSKEAIAAFKNAYQSTLRIKAEITELMGDRKEILKELKNEGYLPSVVERIIKYRKDPQAGDTNNALFDTYLSAITPLMKKEAA